MTGAWPERDFWKGKRVLVTGTRALKVDGSRFGWLVWAQK